MARTLTDPVVPPVITHQAVIDLHFEVAHTHNEATGEMDIMLEGVNILYTVQTFNDNGGLEKTERRRVYYPDWPVAFKTGMRDIYAMVETDAENAGLLGPGVDDPLE